jgi:hypothetical protein
LRSSSQIDGTPLYSSSSCWLGRSGNDEAALALASRRRPLPQHPTSLPDCQSRPMRSIPVSGSRAEWDTGDTALSWEVLNDADTKTLDRHRNSRPQTTI